MMVEKAFETIDQNLNIFQQLDTKHVNKEFRTIRLQLPRQTGQTTSVISVVKQYFKKPLYICNSGMRKFVKQDITALMYEQIRYRQNLVGKTFDCIIIDNASMIGEQQTQEILENEDLEMMSKLHDKFLYILIG